MPAVNFVLSLLCITPFALLVTLSSSAQREDSFADHGVAAGVSNSREAVAVIDGGGNWAVLVWPSDQ